MSLEELRQHHLAGNSKLLTDVAGIFAELGITPADAEAIAQQVNYLFDSRADQEEWAEKAGGSINGGECS